MAARGPYAKGVAKRAEILDAALRIIARNGYSGATVKEIADEVGLSQNGMLHYFGSKDALYIEILRRRDELDRAAYGDFLGEDGRTDVSLPILHIVEHNAATPGLVDLYSRLASEASEPEHPAHRYFRERYAELRDGGSAAFAFELGDEGTAGGVTTERLGVLLFALIDGLQTQWTYDGDAIDMAGSVADFFRLVRAAADAREDTE